MVAVSVLTCVRRVSNTLACWLLQRSNGALLHVGATQLP
jgi:hypothetical protein